MLRKVNKAFMSCMGAFGKVSVTQAKWLSRQPELNVIVFAFLLNYPWEFVQAPFFAGMADAPHWEAVKTCTRAAFGDGAIMLIAYWVVAGVGRGRGWILAPTWRELGQLVMVGVSITVVLELLALHGLWLSGWSYAAAMPLVPGLGVGWVPILQWVVLPPLTATLVRRQIRGADTDS